MLFRESIRSLAFSSCLLLALPAAAADGTVADASGGPVAGAAVRLSNAAGAVLAAAATDTQGRYTLPDLPRGVYLLRISAEGFATHEAAVRLEDGALRVVLEPPPVRTHVTVTATRGAADDQVSSPYLTAVKDAETMAARPLPTLGSALAGEPGILVQQSTYGQVSPFLRGLTGYHVLNLVDGIRFNNSTFRSGPNQYLAFLEPSQAQRVEALLGPAGAQYGSDSLGGTIHVVMPQPPFASQGGWETHGDFALSGATADLAPAANARVSVGTGRAALSAAASGRHHNDLRAGGGADSRNVFRRLFGLDGGRIHELLGSRQQDTGFRQYGLQARLAARLRPDQLLSLSYQRGGQDNVRGYKDLLGGLGRMQSAFDPQELNWFSARCEKIGLGALDSLSGAFSVNSQSDGGVRQNLKATDAVTRDYSRVDVYGYTLQAATHFGSRSLASFGGDLYDERIRSRRSVENPVTGDTAAVRPLYPDSSRYQTLGLFGQSTVDLAGRRLQAGLGGRLTAVRYVTREAERFGVPESSQWFRDLTFHTSLRWQAAGWLGFHAVASRGFRAPNLNDLGAIGLNDLGYEIPAAEAIPAGALLATDAGESALSKGTKLGRLRPESLFNYEFGVRFTARRLYARVQAFNTELRDPIVRRTLLFPAGNAPSRIAGLSVTVIAPDPAQRRQGVAAVAPPMDPRALKAFVNDGRSRYYGIESLARWAFSTRWSAEANYSFLAGRDLDPGRNARRLPPQAGSAALRYAPSGRRPWFEVSLSASGAQERLSGGDLDDERIGASRRRRDIADFFNGSRVAPLLDASGRVFQPTGETLLQIQDRVLPLGATINGVRVTGDATRVPLYTSTAGWAALNLRTGVPLGERWQAMAALENLLDHNYRTHGSGMDAPGITAYLGLRLLF